MLGGATAQSVIKRNESAWQSFFALLDEPSEEPSPPGHWGNEGDGRTLQTHVRNDAYDIQWGERSRLDIRVGQDLKDEFGMGYYERLRLEVRGKTPLGGKTRPTHGRIRRHRRYLSSTSAGHGHSGFDYESDWW